MTLLHFTCLTILPHSLTATHELWYWSHITYYNKENINKPCATVSQVLINTGNAHFFLLKTFFFFPVFCYSVLFQNKSMNFKPKPKYFQNIYMWKYYPNMSDNLKVIYNVFPLPTKSWLSQLLTKTLIYFSIVCSVSLKKNLRKLDKWMTKEEGDKCLCSC